MVVDFKICYLLNMFKKSLVFFLVVSLSVSMVAVPQAQAAPLLSLPEPGSMVGLSHAYQPAMIKGITVHKDNPFLFDFIMDPGQDGLKDDALQQEGAVQIKYFLAALTVPAKELWVNLSPYEKDRTINNALGQTDMGRDMLAQDYILKQLTASLIYPEKALGKTFWDKVYAKTNNVPVNTFNKVWIMADQAEVYEHGQTAFVTKSHLKVMLEEDYLATQKHGIQTHKQNPSAQAIRDVILPELEREVNEGKHFAPLRQIFNAIILAGWYKNNLKASILNQAYADKSMVKGIDLKDKDIKEKIFDRYVQAYKKGVFNYVKEGAVSEVPKKYFSGGVNAAMAATPTVVRDFYGQLPNGLKQISAGLITSNKNAAMTAINEAAKSARFITGIDEGVTFDSGELNKIERLIAYELNGGEVEISTISLLMIQSIQLTPIDPQMEYSIWEEVSPTTVRLKPGADISKAQVEDYVGKGDLEKVWGIIDRAKGVQQRRHDLETDVLNDVERSRLDEILQVINFIMRLYDFRTQELIIEAHEYYLKLQQDAVIRTPFEDKLIVLLDKLMTISVEDLSVYKLRKESFGKMLDMRAQAKKLINAFTVKDLVAKINQSLKEGQGIDERFIHLKQNVGHYLDFIDMLIKQDPKKMSKAERIVWLAYLKGAQLNLTILVKFFSKKIDKQDGVYWQDFVGKFVNSDMRKRLSDLDLQHPNALVLTDIVKSSIREEVAVPPLRKETLVVAPARDVFNDESVKSEPIKFLKHFTRILLEYNIAQYSKRELIFDEEQEALLLSKFKGIVEELYSGDLQTKEKPDSFFPELFEDLTLSGKDKMRKILATSEDVDAQFLAGVYLILVDPWNSQDAYLIGEKFASLKSNQQAFISWIYERKQHANQAMATHGGIDLMKTQANTAIRKDGQGVQMRLDPAMIKRVRREGIDSLTPVIFKIAPVVNIWNLLGLTPPKTQEDRLAST